MATECEAASLTEQPSLRGKPQQETLKQAAREELGIQEAGISGRTTHPRPWMLWRRVRHPGRDRVPSSEAQTALISLN